MLSTNGRAQPKHSGRGVRCVTSAEAAGVGTHAVDGPGEPGRLCNGVASDAPPREGARHCSIRASRLQHMPRRHAVGRAQCRFGGGALSEGSPVARAGTRQALLRFGSLFLVGAGGSVAALTAPPASCACFAVMACQGHTKTTAGCKASGSLVRPPVCVCVCVCVCVYVCARAQTTHTRRASSTIASSLGSAR
jgi:hypothetical protein